MLVLMRYRRQGYSDLLSSLCKTLALIQQKDHAINHNTNVIWRYHYLSPRKITLYLPIKGTNYVIYINLPYVTCANNVSRLK